MPRRLHQLAAPQQVKNKLGLARKRDGSKRDTKKSPVAYDACDGFSNHLHVEDRPVIQSELGEAGAFGV